MDTKLKSINSKKTTRIVALVLAVALFFVSGYSASLFIREMLVYSSQTSDSFTQTPVFRQMLNDYERELLHNGEDISATNIDEFRKTETGKNIEFRRNNALERVEESFTLLDASGIKIYVAEGNRYRYKLNLHSGTYYFTYDGGRISSDDFNSYEYRYEYNNENVTSIYAADGSVVPETTFVEGSINGSYLSRISEALGYLNSLSDYSCYGEIDRVSAVELVNEQYDRELDNYFSSRGYYSSLTGNTNSVKYAVFFSSTGNVITNCDVTRADTREQILGKIGGNYVECYENGKYELLKGKAVTVAEGALHDVKNEFIPINQYKSVIEQKAGYGNIAKMYASYDPTGADIFGVGEEMFNRFASNPLTDISLGKMAAISLITFALACAIGIYLICIAGKKEDGSVELCFADRVPFIINLALGIGVMFLCGAAVLFGIVFEVEPANVPQMPMTLLALIGKPISGWTAALFALFFAIPTLILMSVARNIRNKTFWKHTLVYWLLKPARLLWGKLKIKLASLKKMIAADYINGDGKKFKTLAIVAVCVVAAVFMFTTFLILAINEGAGSIFFIFLCIVCVGIVLYCVVHISALDKIMNAVSQTKNGRLDSKIETKYMPGFMRNFAEDIASMQDGLQQAVENAVKDQRMKAELITNVSHDLKTPLTSIVSYVDLLKKCDVQDETAQKYISVLDEKAAKMKKLIEDLVEASKASSGAIELHPVKINLCEFAAQAVGEHTDELQKAGIEIVLRSTQNPVFVTADAQKTSRIIENLFSNIRKYAMENTRVYVEVSGGNQYGSIVIKNISKYPLDVKADELVQRFVRGDASRTGEGSGLGLSIANNLCELQKGKFNVYVDGDLFKVTVALPIEK